MTSKPRDQPETPSSGTPPESQPGSRAGVRVDNTGAHIGQQVNVDGPVSFGPMTITMPPPPQPVPTPSPPATSPAATPSPATAPAATILLCTANAVYQDQRLHLEEELRAIIARLKSARLRDAFEPCICPAVNLTTVIQELDDREPAYLHFSGHGDPSGALVLLGERGGEQRVTPEHLAQVLAELHTRPTLVTFATCHSLELARAAARHAAFAIGFEGEIDDESAPLFSAMLYERLASRAPVDIPRAFRLARLACIGNGYETVELARLFERPGREVVVPQ